MSLVSVVIVIVKIRISLQWIRRVLFLVLPKKVFITRFFFFDLIELVSFDELYSFDDESDDVGSDSGSAGTCNFPLCFDDYVGLVGKSVGRVSGIGFGIFFQQESIQLVTLFRWSCLYQKESIPKVVDS